LLWGRSGSPLVVDDRVVAGVGGNAKSGNLTTLMAMDQSTGEVVWSNGASQISYSSPTLLTIDGIRQIVNVNEGSATGHRIDDGTVLWKTPWPSQSHADACASQPVLAGTDKILLGKGYALGSKMIEVQCSDKSVEGARKPESWTAVDVWNNTKVLKTKFTNAIFFDAVLFGLSDGVLEAVDPKNGNRLWRGKRYGQGQMIIVNGHLLVTAEDGRVVILPAVKGSTAPDAIAELQVLEGITWNVPAVAGPYLLVRNAEQIACLFCGKEASKDVATVLP
jgi:outer membrane protein assembly factor BamB